MKTSLFWPRITATKLAVVSGNEACGADSGTACRLPTSVFGALLLCLLMAVTGCEAEQASQAQPAPSAPQTQPLAYRSKLSAQAADGSAQYVGSAVCGQCHEHAYVQWQRSHHAMAMAEPTGDSVKGNFDAAPLRGGQDILFSESDGNFTIRLDGADGAPRDISGGLYLWRSRFSNTSSMLAAGGYRRFPSSGMHEITAKVGTIYSLKLWVIQMTFCTGQPAVRTGITCAQTATPLG